jgi:hypothetical protein
MQRTLRDLDQLQKDNEAIHLNRISEKETQIEEMKAYHESQLEKKESETKELKMWFDHQLRDVRNFYYSEREKSSRLESEVQKRTEDAKLIQENLKKNFSRSSEKDGSQG